MTILHFYRISKTKSDSHFSLWSENLTARSYKKDDLFCLTFLMSDLLGTHPHVAQRKLIKTGPM